MGLRISSILTIGNQDFAVTQETQDNPCGRAGLIIAIGAIVNFTAPLATPGVDFHSPALADIRFQSVLYQETSPDIWETDQLPFAAVENVPYFLNRASIRETPMCAFTLPEGNWRVDVFGNDRNTNAWAETSSAEIFVDSPDNVFADANTIYVSTDPAETWPGVPAASEKIIADVDNGQLRASVRNKSGALTRMRIRYGQTVEVDATIEVNSFQHNLNRIDAWGDPQDGDAIMKHAPSLKAEMFNPWNNAPDGDFVVEDVKFRMDYDCVYEKGYHSTRSLFRQSSAPTLKITMFNSEGSGMNTPSLNGRGFLIQDLCRYVDNRNYSQNAGSNGFSFKHFMIRSVLASAAGCAPGDWKMSARNAHGTYRCATTKYVIMYACYVYSAQAWNGGGGNHPEAFSFGLGSVSLSQQGGRFHTSDNGTTESSYGQTLYNEGVVYEGQGVGTSTIFSGAAGDGHGRHNPTQTILRRCLFLDSFRNRGAPCSLKNGGVTLEACMRIALQVRYDDFSGGGSTGSLIMASIGDPEVSQHPHNAACPMRFRGNSLIILSDGTYMPSGTPALTDNRLPFTDIEETANYIYAPSIPNPFTSQGAPVLVENVPFTPRGIGVQFNYELIEVPHGDVDVGPNELTPEVPYSAITRAGQEGRGSATATDQNYWQTRLASDNKTTFSIAGKKGSIGSHYREELGEVEVVISATGIRFRNLTTETWVTAGKWWFVDLDRTSKIATDIPFESGYELNITEIPIYRSQNTTAEPQCQVDLYGRTVPGFTDPVTKQIVPGTPLEGAVQLAA